MKRSRWIATGSVLLAGLIMTMFAPRAAHAIAATAVQIENTISTPVPTQGILPGAPFQIFCQSVVDSVPPLCTSAKPVPAGYIFHATYASTLTTGSAASGTPKVYWVFQTGGGYVRQYVGPAVFTDFTWITGGVVDWYLEPGYLPTCVTVTGGAGTQAECTLTGYLTH